MMKYTVLLLQIRYRPTCEGTRKGILPFSCEIFNYSSHWYVVFWSRIKSVIVVVVMLIDVNLLSVHQTLYDSTLPSGSCQLKERDDVVTLVKLRFLTVAGTKNSRYTNKVRATNSMHHLIFSSEELYSVAYLWPWVHHWWCVQAGPSRCFH